MFGFKYGFGFGFTSGYSPLINYSWSSTYQANNQMYSKNSGTGTDLQLYSGQGVKFNGVDQVIGSKTFGDLDVVGYPTETITIGCRISGATSGVIWNTGFASGYAGASLQVVGNQLQINSNSTENEVLAIPKVTGDVICQLSNNVWSIYVDGEFKASREFVYTTPFAFSSTQVLSIGAYRLTSQYFTGVIGDAFLCVGDFSVDKITKYSTNPNGFFNDALVDDTCVLNMPLAEHSDYCIDYANYSESAEIHTVDPVSVVDWNYLGNNTYERVNGISGINVYETYLAEKVIGAYYVLDIDIIEEATDVVRWFCSFENSVALTNLGVGNHKLIQKLTSSSGHLLQLNSSSANIKLKINGLKKLSGIHQVQNYTDSCRDEAKQLPYGSQNANYKINGLGMRTEESPYFEADGVGKAIIPNHTDNVNISLVVNPTELNGNILSGGLTLDTTDLTVGVDNTINLANQTPIADITLADGFKGTIKSYKEELV